MEKEILYRYVACEATPDEERAVLDWLAEDTSRERELAEVQRQHDIVALSAPLINELYASDRRSRIPQVVRRWSAVAAAVILLLFGGYYFNEAQRFATRSERMQSLVVPAGQHIRLELEDGTTVWLNAGTTFRYPALFTKSERRVKVDGEARFEVAHDTEHPFVVETFACDVEVLGTKFNVEADRERGIFSTALFEGRVAVTSRLTSGERVVLTPNEVVTLCEGRLNVGYIADTDSYRWTEGIVNLADCSFRGLMHRFEKTFGVTVRIEREPAIDIGQGKIRQSMGIDKALEVLQQFADFDYTHDEQNNTVTIR